MASRTMAETKFLAQREGGSAMATIPQPLVDALAQHGARQDDDLMALEGSMSAARDRGRLRLEGKDYQVQDGEICHFRFNVAK